MRTRLALVAVLVALTTVAGCLGAAVGPGIPAATLREVGWSASGEPSTQTQYGLVEVHSQRFGPGGRDTFGGVLVVSVSNIPLVDERRFLPQQIERIEAEENIRLVPAGSEEMTLANAGNALVSADLYDIQGAPVPAKAIIVTHECATPSVFLAVVGYGALQSPGSLLGGPGTDFFAQAKRLVGAVSCQV